MHDRRILIVSTEPLISALLAALLEIEHVSPAFPQGDESPEQAVERLQPNAILIDMEHPDSSSDVFLARMRRANVRIALFSSSRSLLEARQIAGARGLPWFVLPVDRDRLRDIMRALLSPDGGS